jgi:preprotein translocase subunit SecE
VARNRKRAKERRARRPAPTPASRPGVATARPGRPDAEGRTEVDRGTEIDGRREVDDRSGLDERAQRAELESLPAPIPDEELPSPLEHASPDVELADAQIALGRAELDAHSEIMTDEEWAEEEAAGVGGGASDDGPPADGTGSGGGELVPGAAAAPTRRRAPGSRLIHFLQGSWRELQRVQWPDRRQVVQATGVVIGFVIVAGVFLGVADLLAGKLVNFILK